MIERMLSVVLLPLLAFVAAAGVLTITPGIDTAMVLRTSASGGPRAGIAAGLGICGGLFVWGTHLQEIFASSFSFDGMVEISKPRCSRCPDIRKLLDDHNRRSALSKPGGHTGRLVTRDGSPVWA